ncbi:hypothetical protein BegalDRAFT_2715 [Beggiatoa alba B18LD]|uniref:Uncharacterized protein n=1 Tax=Beggiatoa alba B18LD TaxID=395493 RepID=I3CIW3_9GAMM|nr:protein YgfX [Beggiatoa alba]EIJ43556.1 hypothetical protein BegalDRAFT_2715 [Beggiatoa alba B18LD]
MQKTSVFTESIALTLHPSKSFLIVLSIIYGGAGVLLIPLQLPFWLKISLFIILMLHALYSIIYEAFYYQHPVQNAILHLTYAIYADQTHAQIHASSYQHAYLIVLRLQHTNHPKKIDTLIIFADAIAPQSFKQIRIRLKHPYPTDNKQLSPSLKKTD